MAISFSWFKGASKRCFARCEVAIGLVSYLILCGLNNKNDALLYSKGSSRFDLCGIRARTQESAPTAGLRWLLGSGPFGNFKIALVSPVICSPAR